MKPGARSIRSARSRAVVAPSRAHHLFVTDYTKAWPAAKLYGPPGLVGDIADFRARLGARRDLKLDAVLGDEPATRVGWRDRSASVQGRAAIERGRVLSPREPFRDFHGPGFQRTGRISRKRRIFYTVVGARGRFGPHRLVRQTIRDRKAARESVAKILEWDFDRVIVTHGDVLESGGKAKFAAAFSYL